MTTMTVSVTDLPAIQTAITFVVDFIDEYGWHKPDCGAENSNPATTTCDCGYEEALNTLNTLRIKHKTA